ncbi:MAG: hypothetical protein R3Y56_01565 [Akkermansia sp.]
MQSLPTLDPSVAAILLAIGALIVILFACRSAKGQVLRLVLGAIGAFFTVAGVFIFCQCGGLAIDFAMTGGTAWFAAVTLACCALVGAIFTGVFGYLLTRFLNRPLCVGLAYLSIIPIMVGTFLNYTKAVDAQVLIPENKTMSAITLPDGTSFPLEFELSVSRPSQEFCSQVEIVAARHKRVETLSPNNSVQEGNVNLCFAAAILDGNHYYQFSYRPGRLWLMMGNILFFASLLLTLKYRSIPAPQNNPQQ